MGDIVFAHMSDTNVKIAKLIYQIRQERGFTKEFLEKKLGTSQSAVNRIEHGKQNLSLETLARISDVLHKQLITINSGAISLRIDGGNELKGSITVKTSKNAAVSLLSSTPLNKLTTTPKTHPHT